MDILYFQYVQYLALILAILYRNHLRQHSLSGLLPLMVLVCVVETLAHSLGLLGLTSNYGIYNCYIFGSIFLHYFMFYQLLNFKPWQRRLFMFFAVLTIIVSVCEIFISSWSKILSFTGTLSQTEYVFLSCWLLAQLVMDESRAVKLTAQPVFWFAAGIMIFSAGMMVLFGLQPYIRQNKILLRGAPLYQVLAPILNVILYGCYCIAILLCKRTKAVPAVS